MKTLASNLQVQRKLRKRRPSLVVQKIVGEGEREAAENKKNKRDKKNKKPRLTEDNEWWYRDIPLVRSPSPVVRQPALSWKLPHSRPIIKTVCSKTLCMIRPYDYGIYPNSPPSHVCTKLDMKYCNHVGFICSLFDFRNRGLVVKSASRTSSRISAIR